MWPHDEKNKYPFSADYLLPRLKIASGFLIKLNIGAIILLIGIVGCVIPNVFSPDCLTARGSLELLSFIHLSGTMYALALFYAAAAPLLIYANLLAAIFCNTWIWATRLLGATRLCNGMIGLVARQYTGSNSTSCWTHGMLFALGMTMFGWITHADTHLLRRLHDWPSLVADRERMRQVCRETVTETKPGDTPGNSASKQNDPALRLPKHFGG